MKDQEKIKDTEINVDEESSIPVSRKKRKLTAKDVLIIVIPALAALAAVFVAVFFVRSASRKTLTGPGHQYYAGVENAVSADTSLSRSESGKALAKNSNGERALSNLPIYYDDRQAFVVTEDMEYYDPRTGQYSRVDQFTELYKDKNGGVHANRENVDKLVNKGFLYNGKDMYIFLEPVTLRLNGFSQELPALSYVEATYNGTVVIFNYDTKESVVMNAETEVTASADSEDYQILLLSDSYMDTQGKRWLLFNAPDVLDPLI